MPAGMVTVIHGESVVFVTYWAHIFTYMSHILFWIKSGLSCIIQHRISGQVWSVYGSFCFYNDTHLIDDSMYIMSVDVLQAMLKSGASYHDLQAETPFILGINIFL